jgi:hypothetical protein
MLISLYYGIPRDFCKLQATTLKETKFRIRTAIGDSIKKNQNNKESPMHGTGQGSCASPAI